ncbi:unnamed protein product [Closterium sp. Naga37s-1]|nr:unnamed protein product [Closterium sp. Naga37s-1]
MGNQVVIAKAAAAGVASDYWVHDLPRGVVLKDVLAPGRFLKTLDCFHHEGRVIVKVFLKRADLALPLQASHPRCQFRVTGAIESFPCRSCVSCRHGRVRVGGLWGESGARGTTPVDEDEGDGAYEQQLKVIRHRLSGIDKSHVWPFQKWYETERAAYVLRQYLFSTLHDRLGTRPFLGLTFKKWIAFQILKALDQAHSRGVCHGDLKADNVCVTAWNWVFVVDWAPFKPVLVPSDNPAIFSFFFDTAPSGRRRCCIAPERFVSASEWRQRQSEGEGGAGGAQLQPAMDIFSAGCVIAEMFLDGDVLFDLSSLLAYVHGSYNPLPVIDRVCATHPPSQGVCPTGLVAGVPYCWVGALVAHMEQRDMEEQRDPWRRFHSQWFIWRPCLPALPAAIPRLFFPLCAALPTPIPPPVPVPMHGRSRAHQSRAHQCEPWSRTWYRGTPHSACHPCCYPPPLPSPASPHSSPPLQIPCPSVRALVTHMVQRDPAQRLPAAAYLTAFSDPQGGALFPQPAFDALHDQLFCHLPAMDADGRIALTRQLYPRLSRIIASSLQGGGEGDAEGKGVRDGAGGKGSAGEAERGESGVWGSGGGEQWGEQEVAVEGGVEGSGELRGDEQGRRCEQVTSSVREKYDESQQGSSSTTSCESDTGDDTGADGVGTGDIIPGTEIGEGAGRVVRAESATKPGRGSTGARGSASESMGGGVGNSGSAMVLLVGLLTACLRNARLPHSRRHCLLLLHAAAHHCSHAVCLQAVAPFLVAVLAPDGLTATPLHALDTLLPGGHGAASPPLVRCTALTVLTRLLARVRSFPSTDARFFPEYLFPSLSLLPRAPDESVRATLALCLPSLAASALRFLLLAAGGATRATGGSEGGSGQGASEGERISSGTAWGESGDGDGDGDGHDSSSSGVPGLSLATTLTSLKALAAAAERLPEQHMGEVAEVREAVRVAVEELSTLPRSTPPIRLSLLSHAPSLAVFLGPSLATTALLPLLITFLNDPSPRVRSAFFHTLPALCPHVAPSALPAFLLPCLEQALGDTSHSSVPAAAAACLAQLARSQRLQQRRWLLSAARHAAPLLRHPERDVRGAAVAFAAAAAGQLSAVDAHALLLPLLSPSLRYRPALLSSPASLAAALKAPLSAHPAVPPQPPLPAQAGVASWQMNAGQAAAPDLCVPHVLSPAAARETEAGRAAAAGAGVSAGVSAGEHGSKRGVGARGGEEEQGADMGAAGRGEGGAADVQGKRSVRQEEGRDVAMGVQAASGRAAAAAAAAQHVASSTLAHSLSMQYAVPSAPGAAAAAAPYPAMAAALASMRTDTGGQPWPPLPSTAQKSFESTQKWPVTSHWPSSTAHWPSTPLHTPLPASASHSLLVPPLPPLHPSISSFLPVRFPSPRPASSPLSLSLSFHRPPPPLTTHPPSSLTSSTTHQPLPTHSLAPIHLPLAPSLPPLPSPSSHPSPQSPSASFSLAPASPHAQSHPALDLPPLAVPLYSLAHPASALPTAASTSPLPSTTLSPPSLPRPPSALSPSAAPTATLAAAAVTAAAAASAGATGQATLDALAAAQAASAAAAAAAPLPAPASPSVPAAAASVSASCSHATSLPAETPCTPVVGACDQSPAAPAARSTDLPAPHLSSPADLPFAFDSLDDLPSPPPTSSPLPTSHSASQPSLPPTTTPHSSTTPTRTPASLPPSNALPPHTTPLLPHTLHAPPPAPPPPTPVSHSLVFLGTTQPHTRISSLSLSLRSSRRPPSSSALPPSASPAPHTLPPAMPAAGPASMRAAEARQGGRAEEEINRRVCAAGREGHTALLERPGALAGATAGGEVPARAASHALSSGADRSAAHVNATSSVTSSATSASPHLVEPGGVRAGTTGHAQLAAAAQLAAPSAAGQPAGAEAEESRERRAAAAVSSEVQRLLGWGSADDGAAMALPPASPSPLSTTAAAWRPRGVLVAQLHEHRAAVPALAVAPNSQWFASASHDGTVKVWDATRLDRGTAFRSKLTYAPGGAAVAGAGKATAVAVMGDSATAAVGYASGEVHVVHVDYAPRFLSSPDSYRCITRMPALEPSSPSSPSSPYNHGPGASRGAILSVHSWAGSHLGATHSPLSASSSSLFASNPLSSSHALLLVASLHGGITLWDMRAARPAFSLHLHASLGAPTHVLPDPQHGLWLLAASSCSALCLWDLRFLLPLSSWRLPSAPSAPHPPPITALAPMLPAAFPPAGDAMGAAAAGGPEHLPGWFGADRGRGGTGGGAVGATGGGAAAAGAAGPGGAVGGASRPLVYVASGRDEVGLWSADTGQCHQPASNTAPPPSLPSPSNLPTALQSRPHLLPLPPFSTTTTTPSGRTLSSSPCLPNGPLPQSTQSTQSGARQARQSALRVEQLKEPPGRAGGVRALLGVPGGGALLTAGTDCCIRYWCRLRWLPLQVVATSGDCHFRWLPPQVIATSGDCHLRPEQSGWVSGPTARGARGEVLHPRYDMRIVHGARVIQVRGARRESHSGAWCTARESFRCVVHGARVIQVHALPACLPCTVFSSTGCCKHHSHSLPLCLPLCSSHPSTATPSHASSIPLHPPQETPPPFYVDVTRQRASGTAASTPQAGGRAAAGSQGHADSAPGGAAGGGGGGAGGGGRRSMVEVAAVDVGGCHRDAVLALAVADPGQRLLLSASRDGVVNVWR